MAKNAKRPVYVEFKPEKVQRSAKESNMETTETEKSTSTKLGKQIATTTLTTNKVIQPSVIRPSAPKKELLPPPKKESLLPAKKESLFPAKKERYIQLRPQEKSARQEKYVGKKSALHCYVDPETEKDKEKDLKSFKSKREDYLLAQTQKEKLSRIEDYLLARTQFNKDINKKEDYVLAQSTRTENDKKGKKTTTVGTHREEHVSEHYIKAFAGAGTKSDRSHEVSLKSDRESPGKNGLIPSGLLQMQDLVSDASKTITDQNVVVTSALPPVPKKSPGLSIKSPPEEPLTSVTLKPSVKKPATKRCSLKVKLIIGFVLFIVVTIIFICIIILVVTKESEEKIGSSITRQSTTQTDKRIMIMQL